MKDKINNTLANYLLALQELRNLGVLPNSKDFTSQLGEWIVEEIYQGKRAENGIQKYWDVDCSQGKIQVKTHAKGDKTKARWSNIKKIETKEIDHVVIIVFNKNYELQEFYNAPWAHVFSNIREHKDADRIFWDNLKDYKIPINELKQHKSLEIFLKYEERRKLQF